MKNLKNLPKNLSAADLARILAERQKRADAKARKEKYIDHEHGAQMPELSEEAKLILAHRERIARLAASERRKNIAKKWIIQ